MAPSLSTTSRPILTCDQCRLLKLRCDKRKPQCSRCLYSGRVCHYGPLPKNTDKEEAQSSSPAESDATSKDSESDGESDGESACAEAGKCLSYPHSSCGDSQPCMGNQSLRSNSEVQDFHGPFANPRQSNIPQKRCRAVLSCSRCRKLKVKCDRQNPCGRCGKYGHRCKYLPSGSFNNMYDGKDAELSAPKIDLPTARDLFEAKHCTENHWYSLIKYAGRLLAKNGVDSLDDYADNHPITGDRTSPNYPFVACYDNVALYKAMPSRPIVELLVRLYFDTTGQIFWIIDVGRFQLELQQFWEQPEEVSAGWMAQLFLMMSLGCDAQNMVNSEFAASHGHLPEQFLDQANAFLHQTPFMFRPDICTIRSLCLMVIAKQMFRKSCLEEDASWCLTGMIKRLAMGLNLHLDHPSNNTSTYLESGTQRRLWTTIMYLDLRQSVLSGLPLLIEPMQISDVRSSCMGSYDSFTSPSGRSTPRITTPATDEEALQDIFRRVLPLAHEVVLAARAVDCSYEAATRIDKEVREVLRELQPLPAETASTSSPQLNESPISHWEIVYLDNLFRRLLLELHRRFAYKEQAAIYYPVSHWSTLDCAAAMLVLQQRMSENSDSTAGQWLSGIFRSDFFVAGLTVSVYLIQDNSSLDSPTLPGGYARNTLLDTLRSCRDIAAQSKDKWVCELRKFQFLDQVISALDQGII